MSVSTLRSQVSQIGDMISHSSRSICGRYRNRLGKYHYQSGGRSLVGPYLKPSLTFWSGVLGNLGVSANQVSLTGLILILWSYMEDWTLGPTILAILTYAYLDCLDGVHARSTGTQSALGEIIDHVGDHLVAVVLTLHGCRWFNLGQSYELGVWDMIILTSLMFQSSHFTAFERRQPLYLGDGVGPTEGLIILCGVSLLSHTVYPIDLSLIDDWIGVLILGMIIRGACLYNNVGDYSQYVTHYLFIYLFSHWWSADGYLVHPLCRSIVLIYITYDLIYSKLVNKELDDGLIILWLVWCDQSFIYLTFGVFVAYHVFWILHPDHLPRELRSPVSHGLGD